MSNADIRVLHLLNSATGGAARSSLDLIRQLEQQFGFSQQAVACHAMGTKGDRDEIRDAVDGRVMFCDLVWWNRKMSLPAWKRSLVGLRQQLKTGWGFRSAWKVAEFARRQKSNLVHTNSFTINDGCEVSRKLGIPHVWHLRELIGPDSPFVFPLEGHALGTYVQANSEAVIANSSASARGLQPFVEAGHVRTIPNGIDVKSFRSARERSEGARSGPLVVGMVANLTSRMKSHDLFLRAAALTPRDSAVEFRIYGYESSGSRRRDGYVMRLRELAEQPELRGRVRFMGYVPDPASIMGELDMLVHPCGVESFGRVVLEAMAAGLPVVSVRAGGVQDVVVNGDTGFLEDVDDAGAIARRIRELVQSPQLRDKMGTAGRKRAEREFSLLVTTTKVVAVYEEVCSRFCRTPGENGEARKPA